MNSTEVMKLFGNGTALIIDDQVHKKNTKIFKLKNELEEKGICFVCFDEIPSRKLWNSFANLSFLIIDWNLHPQTDGGIVHGATLLREEQEEVIEFIAYALEHYLLPIFLFTQEHIRPVLARLSQHESIHEFIKKKQLIVKPKNTLSERVLEDYIGQWCMRNPAAYTLKTLDFAFQQARKDLLCSLNSYDSEWPIVVYQTLLTDNSAGIDDEFGDFLIDSLVGRLPSVCLDSTILTQSYKRKNRKQLINLYSSAKICAFSEMQPQGPHTGDIYRNKREGTSGKDEYLINITASCDLRKNKMIMLKGIPVKTDKVNYDTKYGLVDKHVSATVPSFDNHECVEFKFSDFYVIQITDQKYDEVVVQNGSKNKKYIRIGKLIHPYITVIQERYSHYICRHGMIRHPEIIFKP